MLITIAIALVALTSNVMSHFCGNNKIPYGLEIYRNGQPALLCSRPNCFDKFYADCDERAMRKSCDSNSSWVGGFDKGLGMHQPLYVQCCEFELFAAHSENIYQEVTIRPGEYFEGEEITDKFGDGVIAFDVISNIHMVPEANSSVAYKIDVRRFHCNKLPHPRIKTYSTWP
ncbi:hypothetical protein QR680_002849 [Steinernema hermaphroditum]|uniref:WxxW domain-containing protein n=1 Tax=Steinernema hermaphroditum TaxID=289476 RepID=A0AA39LJ61_9BILA|nr:hypothetical protein QR680_002849 [Steinernema hermaphroditum]